MRSAERSEKKRERRSLGERVHDMLDVPLESVSAVSVVEVKGGCEAVVIGCRGVLEYGRETILLRVREGTVRILGASLEMQSLLQDSVTVRGVIEAVHLTRSTMVSSEDAAR